MKAADSEGEKYDEKGEKEKDCMDNRAAAPKTAILLEEVTWTDFELDAIEGEGAKLQNGGENEHPSATQMDAMMALLANGFENANQLLEDM
jgi:hypothetical protein